VLQIRRDLDLSRGSDPEEPAVEQIVDVGSKKQAIRQDIGWLSAVRLDMCRLQYLFDGSSRDSAGAVVCHQQGLTEGDLTLSLENVALSTY
jgi:hypothetical protein